MDEKLKGQIAIAAVKNFIVSKLPILIKLSQRKLLSQSKDQGSVFELLEIMQSKIFSPSIEVLYEKYKQNPMIFLDEFGDDVAEFISSIFQELFEFAISESEKNANLEFASVEDNILQ